ncbi:MAG: hypothetical protein KDA75_10590, partial [Planctomycetaceae bacterium]|nr:hypothetical protein [Planctomycetaceae bacterium]
MFDLSIHWLVTALDASLKALLLAILAALVLRMLQVTDTNLRHRVWTGVLLGMLTLPLLSQVVPTLQLPFAIDLGGLVERWEARQAAALAAAEAAAVSEEPPLAVTPPVIADEPPMATTPTVELKAEAEADSFADAPPFSDVPVSPPRWPTTEFNPSRDFDPPADQLLPQDVAQSPRASEVEVAETAASADLPAPLTRPAPPSWFDQQLARWPQWLFLVWGAGAGLLALRLLLAIVGGRWLWRHAAPVEPAELTDLGLTPDLFSVHGRTIELLECDRLRVPITLGWWRPKILLPLDWIEWPTDKLAAVLTHERTHVERRDCAVMFLAELNRCVAWFHPLAWWLKRHLSALAEAACDDAVIGSTGDRTSYARHLLEVASVVSQQRGRVVHTGVSMARRSNVETRIHSILDFTRPLSQQLTRATTLVLLAVIVPVIALAAALQPRGENSGSESSTATVLAVEEVDKDSDPIPETIVEPDPATKSDADLIPQAVDLTALDEAGANTITAVDDANAHSAADAPPDEARFFGTVVDPDGRPV